MLSRNTGVNRFMCTGRVLITVNMVSPNNINSTSARSHSAGETNFPPAYIYAKFVYIYITFFPRPPKGKRRL